MATYEITVSFPDRSFEENRELLIAVAATRGRLDHFRPAGPGVALVFVIEGDIDRSTAVLLARQRAAGIWPNDQLAITEVADRWAGQPVP